MKYKEYIKKISSGISKSIVDLEINRKRSSPPTQAFSDFLTHSEQGDWAELLFYNSLKESEIDYIPVRYGKSDKIIAGDPGFKDFYNGYQDELDEIGKRPDVLLFSPNNYDAELGIDISGLSSLKLSEIVIKAKAGFEVRSSAYLTKKFQPKKGRPYLSFTPKVEDLLVVLKWIETFNVPHYYVQVFFDSIYIISFSEILMLLKNSDIEEKGRKNRKIIGSFDGEPAFQIEKNPKNQYKETIHIFLNQGHLLSENVTFPSLKGSRKELAGGRLLHYVSFSGGKTRIDESVLLDLIENSAK